MVRLLVTFMQQRQPPSGAPLAAPVPGAQIGSERMDVSAYLALYRTVGEATQWDDRLRMPERALDEFLRAESTIVRVLRVQGGAVGLLEAVRHEGPEFEIANFGIVPDVQGRGLGA